MTMHAQTPPAAVVATPPHPVAAEPADTKEHPEEAAAKKIADVVWRVISSIESSPQKVRELAEAHSPTADAEADAGAGPAQESSPPAKTELLPQPPSTELYFIGTPRDPNSLELLDEAASPSSLIGSPGNHSSFAFKLFQEVMSPRDMLLSPRVRPRSRASSLRPSRGPDSRLLSDLLELAERHERRSSQTSASSNGVPDVRDGEASLRRLEGLQLELRRLMEAERNRLQQQSSPSLGQFLGLQATRSDVRRSDLQKRPPPLELKEAWLQRRSASAPPRQQHFSSRRSPHGCCETAWAKPSSEKEVAAAPCSRSPSARRNLRAPPPTPAGSLLAACGAVHSGSSGPGAGGGLATARRALRRSTSPALARQALAPPLTARQSPPAGAYVGGGRCLPVRHGKPPPTTRSSGLGAATLGAATLGAAAAASGTAGALSGQIAAPTTDVRTLQPAASSGVQKLDRQPATRPPPQQSPGRRSPAQAPPAAASAAAARQRSRSASKEAPGRLTPASETRVPSKAASAKALPPPKEQRADASRSREGRATTSTSPLVAVLTARCPSLTRRLRRKP
eukprot:TRINITY_DN40646_c0_g1_i1.p1 TRINITY_DN40646_c0_g1~~TRINITY_DN40646_c0_g1_i1.p1  ORF type:complete len:567 (+),score=136.02 TRINITY_DN40646_c0_g1_i1:134-1834(+)